MALYNLAPLYVKQSELPEHDTRQLALVLCEKTDEWVHREIRSAQLIAGVWSIIVNSQQARTHLIEKVRYININNHIAQFYDEYPTVVKCVPTEKVILKDLPFHVEDTDIFAYLNSQPDIQITTRNIIHAKLRNQKRELTPFLSGERFVYIKTGLRRALPSVVDINHNQCRIFHPSQEKSCSRCRYMGHSRQNTEVCNAYTENSDIIPIRSANNVMSNFYQCVITLDGIDFKSS